jgi:hypothetical protein
MKSLAGEIAKKRKKPAHVESEDNFEDHRGLPELSRESVDDETVANPESLEAHAKLAEALHKIADAFLPNEGNMGEVDAEDPAPAEPAMPEAAGLSENAKIAIENKKKKRRFF